MPSNQRGVSVRPRCGSVSQMIEQGHIPSGAASTGYEGTEDSEDRFNGLFQRQKEPSPSRTSFPSSLNQKTPARSYFQRSMNDSRGAVDITQNASQGVREDTAELASWALSDITSTRSGHSPSRHLTSSLANPNTMANRDSVIDHDDLSQQVSKDPSRPNAIQEVSEPSSPRSSSPSRTLPSRSALTEMMRNSPPTVVESYATGDGETLCNGGIQPVTVGEGIISQPSEQTALLLKRTAYGLHQSHVYGTVKDLESQRAASKKPGDRLEDAWTKGKAYGDRIIRKLTSPKSWNRQEIWRKGIRRPASYVPPVVVGLLLNILDALSYGMILFPLGQPVFANLGPDGISMFYVSCIVSQLVYSLGGSIFQGGVGSEMIEVVPFFHKMAFTILARVGDDNPKSVLATTVLSYSLSAILTGAVFFAMGLCKSGSLIGFFPRHILIGCIGGVGWFLVATGLEVSARLDGNLEYNLATIHKLIQQDTIALWLIPLALAAGLVTIKRWYKHPLTDSVYFLSIIAIFYFFVWALPALEIPKLRSKGWIFEAPEADFPFYHFYELYDFGAVDWKALGATVPAMFALTFFGVLHVPINVPAIGMQTGEDNVDVDRELKAHGISNVLSGFCGSIQNYLVYANTVLFMKSGGDSRLAGLMLAIATFGVLVAGPTLIGFVPIMVVGALIFYLGSVLLKEALVDSWGKVNRLEYLTIIIIVVTMGAWDFVVGILVGIVSACVSYVLQTSQISAIRNKLYGGVANSTVRRHPIQRQFLQRAGKQIHIMKLAGYLFFGTIVGVEKDIRLLLDAGPEEPPIRYLVLDLYKVDGVDFSAAEAFGRISRILSKKHVQLVICVTNESTATRSLRNVGFFEENDGVQYFETLNSALEYCENELLKALYQQRDSEIHTGTSIAFLGIPTLREGPGTVPNDTMNNSPRRNHLHQVVTTTLSEQSHAPPAKWQDYQQPLALILQTFSTVSGKPEDFWYPIVTFFTRERFTAGGILFKFGDPATAFYMLESGILKAKYHHLQGKYEEAIVAGTTCGELPFFADTPRTATAYAERDCTTWKLDREHWEDLQKKEPAAAHELNKIALRLTTERMDNITKYMLLMTG